MGTFWISWSVKLATFAVIQNVPVSQIPGTDEFDGDPACTFRCRDDVFTVGRLAMKRLFVTVMTGSILLTGLIQNAAASSRSATTIEMDKPVHFVDVTGKDVIIPEGRYTVEEAEGAIRVIAEEEALLWTIHVAPLRHDVVVPSPLALSFTLEEDTRYLLLYLPDGRGLSAVGSYSGVYKRDVGVTTVSLPLSLQQRANAAAVAKALSVSPTAATVTSAWQPFVFSLKGTVRTSQDINQLLTIVLMQAAKSATEDMKAIMEMVKNINKQKAQLRKQLGALTKQTPAEPDQATRIMQEIASLEGKEREAQEDLKNRDNQSQATIQKLSRLSEFMRDVAMRILRP